MSKQNYYMFLKLETGFEYENIYGVVTVNDENIKIWEDMHKMQMELSEHEYNPRLIFPFNDIDYLNIQPSEIGCLLDGEDFLSGEKDKFLFTEEELKSYFNGSSVYSLLVNQDETANGVEYIRTDLNELSVFAGGDIYFSAHEKYSGETIETEGVDLQYLKNEFQRLTGEIKPKYYKVYNINYDTDGEKIDLPKEIVFEINDSDFEPSIELADKISDKTGFCVNSYEYENYFPQNSEKECIQPESSGMGIR
ncbi:MAG: hypothetical protein ACOCP4_03125 [Candidatus Woesearchaeota archaeon]